MSWMSRLATGPEAGGGPDTWVASATGVRVAGGTVAVGSTVAVSLSPPPQAVRKAVSKMAANDK
jgi:hypothetical protein